MPRETFDLVIIGAGAAGLAAAIFAARRAQGRDQRIIVLDRARTIGAKILVSGGGRCNVTHETVRAEDFSGGPRHLIRHVLKAFDEHAAAKWFESMGVALKRETTGKLFPVTDRARTVLAALLDQCAAAGVEVRGGCQVHEVRHGADGRGFEIVCDGANVTAARVILATGGRSLPRSGSDGHGYKLAQSLGHTVTPTAPALAPLVLANSMFHAQVSGVATPATLSTFIAGKRIDRRTGDLLWTHFGISGPVAMDASRHWTLARETDQPAILRCALLPEMDFAAAERWFMQRATTSKGRATVAHILRDKLPIGLAGALAQHAGIDPATSTAQLKKECRKRLMHTLTELDLPVLRDRGWNYAEVTAGGVPLTEVDHRTMASRRAPGLYLAGEILDVDGRIGGFNFQWAWSTGHLAGTAAASG